KGVPVYAATSFLVAAPVVNPLVLLSTAFAFQGNPGVVALRFGMTLSVAVAVGLLADRLVPAARSSLPSLTTSFTGPDKDEIAVGPRLTSLVNTATAEYFDVIFFIFLGALFTAATPTLVRAGAWRGRPAQSAGGSDMMRADPARLLRSALLLGLALLIAKLLATGQMALYMSPALDRCRGWRRCSCRLWPS